MIFLFVPLGIFVTTCLGGAALRGLRDRAEGDPRPQRMLLIWVLLELAAYFTISPYPAARRMLGLGVAATLLAARAVSRLANERDVRAGVRIAVGFGLALGALYFGADLADARARRALVAHAERRLAELGADDARERVWFIGHWEFQFHAERAGMRPVVAGASHLRPRDWLLLPHGVSIPRLSFPGEHFKLEDEIVATSPSPWSTIPFYYSGSVPMRRQSETQVTLRIFRVVRDLVPRLKAPPP